MMLLTDLEIISVSGAAIGPQVKPGGFQNTITATNGGNWTNTAAQATIGGLSGFVGSGGNPIAGAAGAFAGFASSFSYGIDDKAVTKHATAK